MLSNKLKFLRENKGLTQTELAALLHLSNSTVTMYELGKREPNIETINKIADYFNVSLDYLLGNEPFEYKKSNNKYITINVYGFIPAGIPLECIEEIIDTEDISIDMLKGDKQYFGLKIKGDSMEPEYKNNDTIILEKCSDCESGQDCVVMVNGYDGTFKRIIKSTKGITLLPLNKKYKPMEYTNEQIENFPIKIVGKVVELRRSI